MKIALGDVNVSPLQNSGGNGVATIMGQNKVNQLGGHYINGKPLPDAIRNEIVLRHKRGIKPCQISRDLKISHGAVSKILNRYQETGSTKPGQIGGNQRHRMSTQSVEPQILHILDQSPHRSPQEVQQALIDMRVCTKHTAPTVTSITRHLKSRRILRSDPQFQNELPSPSNSDGDKKNNSFYISSILGHNTETRPNSADTSPNMTPTVRSRTNFSPEQVDVLENAYNKNNYPGPEEKEEISRVTGLNQEKIAVWFSNRRARIRKTLTSGMPLNERNPVINPQLFLMMNSINALNSPARPEPPLLPPMPFIPWLNPAFFLNNNTVFRQT